jgi:hypothetical protein
VESALSGMKEQKVPEMKKPSRKGKVLIIVQMDSGDKLHTRRRQDAIFFLILQYCDSRNRFIL